MGKKKVIFLLVSLVLMASFAPFVNAQTQDFIPQILKDFLKWIFLTLPEQAQSGQEAFVIYFRLILWVAVFAIVYLGASRIFRQEGGNNRIAATVSAIFALISVMFIPKGILMFLFTTYSAVVSISMALAPAFIGIYLSRQIPSEFGTLRGLLILTIGALAMFMGAYFMGYSATGDAEKAFLVLGQYMSIGGIFAVGWAILTFWTGSRWARGHTATTPADIATTTPGATPTAAAVTTLTTAQRRLILQVQQNINQMNLQYGAMLSLINSFSGPAIGLNRGINYIIHGHRGSPPITINQITHLNSNRGPIRNAYDQYVHSWDYLYHNIDQISALNREIIREVLTALSRPI